MVATVDQFLGHGMYTLGEAARYAKVDSRLLSRWLFGTKSSKSAVRREIDADEKLVSFVDFIQCLTVRQARTQRHLSLQSIREAVEWLRVKHGIEYPFARAHKLYTFDDEIVYDDLSGSDPHFVSGRQKEQRLMRPIIQEHLADLTFDMGTGLANEFVIHRHPKFPITMRARSRFGEPTMPSGYTAATLWDAVTTEGGFDEAAEACAVDVEEVRVAFRFYDSILTAS